MYNVQCTGTGNVMSTFPSNLLLDETSEPRYGNMSTHPISLATAMGSLYLQWKILSLSALTLLGSLSDQRSATPPHRSGKLALLNNGLLARSNTIQHIQHSWCIF